MVFWRGGLRQGDWVGRASVLEVGVRLRVEAARGLLGEVVW